MSIAKSFGKFCLRLAAGLGGVLCAAVGVCMVVTGLPLSLVLGLGVLLVRGSLYPFMASAACFQYAFKGTFEDDDASQKPSPV